ncbi:MAG: hypothetical protein QCI82_00010 [Candidatus Thermoplasmatota archaeon]|nr:hypothetical protein [Candidatus Thermoplasmatota archaeon]
MGWPDVSVIGQVQGGNGNTVDIVWIKNEDNNDKVKYARSLDGGGTFNYIEIDDDGDSGFNNLRYVAVDSFWSDASTYKCCVIWTTSDDVYYKIRNNNAAFLEQRNADTSEYDSDYVDVAIYKNSSDTIVFHGTWQRSGSAVLYGCDP